jgi:autotransporter-associated beta strand protein
LVVAGVAGEFADVQMSSGSLTVGKQLALGNAVGSFGGYNQSGGSASVGGFLVVGFNGDQSVFNQSGGTFTLSAAPETIGAGNASSVGLMNLGGTASFNASGAAGNGVWVGEFSTATLNVSGSAVMTISSDGLIIARGNGANQSPNAMVNLLGGTIIANYVAKTSTGGTGNLNFNGGTLEANLVTNDFIQGLSAVYVYNGGAFIDDGGNAVTINQPLLAPAGYGVASIAVTNGGSGYLDTPIVTLTGGSGSGAAAVAQINPVTGTVTNLWITSPGNGYALTDVLTVTLAGGGGSGAGANVPVLALNTSGGLTKLNTGTLTLTGGNTYTGNTTVSAGTLEIAQPVLAASSTVAVASGAVLKLDFTKTNTVAGVVLNGVSQGPGLYNSTTASTYLAGTGSLLVPSPTASNPTNITAIVSGTTLTITWPEDHKNWILQAQTNTLGVGLSNNWYDVPGSAAGTNSVISINPKAPAVFYRLRHP